MWGKKLSERRVSESETGRLKERRRRSRKRLSILLSILAIVLLAVGVWATWQPSVRVAHTVVVPANTEHEALVASALTGSYAWLIPRDSILFLPIGAIRRALAAHDARVQAVSVRRINLTSIAIETHGRTAVATWCGGTESAEQGECYFIDAEGFIFALAASTSPTLNSFAVYDPLVSGEVALRATLKHAEALPDAFDFARRVGELGSSVTKLIFRDDEADLILASGTRVTYVVGSEVAAFADLISAKSELDLSSGALDYIDLRFPGKVYLKKKTVDSQQSTV